MRGFSLRAKARKYAVSASTAFRERTTYRGSFLGSALAYGLFVFVFSRVWAAAFEGRMDIEGYGRAQLVWYFVIAEIPSFAFARSFWSLSQDMKSGQVAYLVSRPYSFVLYSYAQGMGSALANCGILFAEGAALGLLAAGVPSLGVAQALLAFVAIALAGSAYFLLNLAIAMTALWVEENAAFFWIFQKLMLVVGTLMPIEFLPPAAQRVSWWTPFPALSYAPARIFAAWPGAEGSFRLIGFQLAWICLAALICQGIYALGRSKLTVNGG